MLTYEKFMTDGTSKPFHVFIRAVPNHRDSPLSARAIAAKVAAPDAPSEGVIATTNAVLTFLDLFGLIEWSDGACRIECQVAHYFRESLAWYSEHSLPLLANWRRYGVTADIHLSHLLESAPYFLRLIEERRLSLAEQENQDSGASRIQPVAVVLMKVLRNGQSYFLHSWDTAANQFQLIGGRIRNRETPVHAARREFLEEAGFSDLSTKDPRLFGLNGTPVVYREISRTYGALTEYQMYFFAATVSRSGKLAPGARWLSETVMRAGFDETGRKVSQLFARLEAADPDALHKVPASPISEDLPALEEGGGAPKNVYYGPVIGTMINSQAQQGTTQSRFTNATNIEDLRAATEALSEVAAKLPLPDNGQAQVLALLAVIKSQLDAPQPSEGILKQSWKAAYEILQHAVGHTAGAAMYHDLPSLIARLSTAFG